MDIRTLIENKATEGLNLVLMRAIEGSKKLGDGKELSINIKLKITKEDNGDYAIDGLSSATMSQSDKHKIELVTFNPDHPDLFENEVE